MEHLYTFILMVRDENGAEVPHSVYERRYADVLLIPVPGMELCDVVGKNMSRRIERVRINLLTGQQLYQVNLEPEYVSSHEEAEQRSKALTLTGWRMFP